MDTKPDLKNFALCSFSIAGGVPSSGLVIDSRVIALRALVDADHPDASLFSGSVFEMLQGWGKAWPMLQDAADSFRSGSRANRLRALSVPAHAVRLHAPVEAPRQIFCAGANYRKHVIDMMKDRFRPEGADKMTAEELQAYGEKRMDERTANGEPFFFSKMTTCVHGPYEDVVVPPLAKETDWELELAVVIGRRGRNIPRAEVFDYVAGYAVAHDISTRDRMYRPGAVGADFIQAKCLPGFFPLGPYLVPKAFVPDPQQLQIVLKLNGEIKQNESTADMIYTVARQIEYLSKWLPLYPGDIISTGSPAGNGTHYNRYLRAGDIVEGTITGLGTQRTRFVSDPDTTS